MMHWSPRLAVLVGAAIILAGAARGQSLTQSPATSAPSRADAIAPLGGPGGVAAHPIVLSMTRPDADPQRTAIDHRFAPDGLVGSVGYLCDGAPFANDAERASAGPFSGIGKPGTFLGASLGVSFR